jgi:hypothetical protein
MDVSLDGRSFGRMNFVGAYLAPSLGGYRLSIAASFDLSKEDKPYALLALQVLLSVKGPEPINVGYLVPESVSPLHTYASHPHRDSRSFSIFITPSQLEQFETLRKGKDLCLQMTCRGLTRCEGRQCDWFGQLDASVPSLQWIEQLRVSGASDLAVFEVKMPIGTIHASLRPAAEYLLRARQQFAEGHYDAAASTCRLCLEAITTTMDDDEEVRRCARDLVNRDTRDRLTMKERIKALRSTAYALTSAAHHPGEPETFTRSTAQLLLSMTAAVLGATEAPSRSSGAGT